jgi:2'-hydroxyisoflavone reductase
MTEKHPKCFSRERGSYGYKKLMAEEFFLKQKDLNASIVRPTYIYGPFDYSRRLIYIFERIRHRKPVLVIGDGKNILQLGYVDDVARIMISTIGNEKAFNEAFNVGGEELVTLEQLIQIIARILGEEARIEFKVKTNEETCSFPDFHYFVSLNKAKNLLGFQPISLQEGMEKTIFWWKNKQ